MRRCYIDIEIVHESELFKELGMPAPGADGEKKTPKKRKRKADAEGEGAEGENGEKPKKKRRKKSEAADGATADGAAAGDGANPEEGKKPKKPRKKKEEKEGEPKEKKERKYVLFVPESAVSDGICSTSSNCFVTEKKHQKPRRLHRRISLP
jgi:ADP-heptose:LPS heptosyltransferase